MVERYDESLEILFQALESGGEPTSYEGASGSFTGGTSDKTYTLAGTRGWGIVVPPLLPYEALREQLDLYRATCAEHFR